jgi:glycine C-acetyltransferase
MGDIRFLDHLRASLDRIEADGLMKRERLIEGAQGAHVTIGGRRMLNLCANNYLGLADDPRLVAAAGAAMHRRIRGGASHHHLPPNR